ncbi:MAG: DEAD/DEAH box helicase, partial [Kiritimatiellae bacterium]|nr:DEAD/DEAH box helicase [Kiritimatiellia bacterium]
KLVPPPNQPRLHFWVPDDWADRYAEKGVVPLALSVNLVGAKPSPCTLRDIVSRKVHLDRTPGEDDLLFTLERIFPVALPVAEGRTLALDRKAFFSVLERMAENSIPMRPAHGDPVYVLPPEKALKTVLHVRLDEPTGRLALRLETAIEMEEGGPRPRIFTYRDAVDWRDDAAYALHEGVLYPLQRVIPSAFGAVYMQDEYLLPRRETMDFVTRQLGKGGKFAGNMKPLREILGADGLVSTVDESVFTVKPGRPKFLLEVSGSPASLMLSLKAVYAGLPASGGEAEGAPIVVDVVAGNPSDRFTVPDPDDLFLYWGRNRLVERRAVQRLAGFGLAVSDGDEETPPDKRVWRLPKIVGDDRVLDFFGGTAPSLSRHNWRIVLDPGLQAFAKTFVRVAPRITVASIPGANAFELGYRLASSNGKFSITDAEYKSTAPNHSWCYHDGRVVLFDRAAIEDLNSVLAECTNTRGRPRADKGEGPGATRRIADTYTHFVKSVIDSLASSGVVIESAPESWLHEADIEAIRAELQPAVLGEPVKSLLRPYQKLGVAWLRYLELKDRGGILADEMGLGKTIQTLAWISLKRLRGEGPAIVVCPTSLVFNWVHEARHFTPELKTVAMAGAGRRELFGELQGADLVVTSYALMRRDIEEYRAIKFSAVVLDEAQNIKNRNTQNAKSVKRLNHDAARLVVTGTPVENTVADLWSVMDFLMPGYLGRYETFKRNYEEPLSGPPETGEYIDASERLHDKLAPFILRRLKKEVAKELPPKIVKTSWCELTPEQRAVYDRILDESRREVTGAVHAQGFEKSRMIILTVLLRLRQVCCHLGLVEDSARAERPSGKLEHMMQILDEATSAGHRVLVFSQFVKMLGILRDELRARGMDFCYLDGASKDRMEQVQRFNADPSIPVFLISLKAGGAGLNLTGADEVIHFDPWWNPAVEDQATDRAHRIGQKNTVYSLRLITVDTVEERVLQMQRRKRAIIDSVVGGDEQTMSKLTWADVQKLLDIE